MIAGKAKRFQDPPRCSSVSKLWDALPAWEQLGSEVAAGNLVVPPWLKVLALDKFVPEDLLKTMMSKPELSDFDAR